MFKNFDFGWFLTTPGMLTCLGCLLIIISIIIFISSLRSNKKTNVGDANTDTQVPEASSSDIVVPVTDINQVNTVSANSMTQPAPSSNISNINNQVEVPPVEMPTVNVNSEVKPVEVATINNTISATPVTISPTVTPVEATPVSVAPENVSTTQVPLSATPEIKPVEATSINIAPEITPVEQTPINIAPEVNPAEVASTPVINETPVQQVELPQESVSNQSGFAGINIQPNIQPVPPVNNNIESNPVNLPYGGVSPTVTPLESPSSENKVIYGGADPLAGTGIIPAVQTISESNKNEEIESL